MLNKESSVYNLFYILEDINISKSELSFLLNIDRKKLIECIKFPENFTTEQHLILQKLYNCCKKLSSVGEISPHFLRRKILTESLSGYYSVYDGCCTEPPCSLKHILKAALSILESDTENRIELNGNHVNPIKVDISEYGLPHLKDD